MTVRFQCEACGGLIPERGSYIDLAIRVIIDQTSLTPDAKIEYHGDYCRACVRNGAATKNLLAAVERAEKKK